MYSVYQHWDPLKVCVVGRSYPPEFYSWITVPHVRSLFEKIAVETEEDYQLLIQKLQEFGVQVMRPNLPTCNFIDGKFIRPPMTPRDHTVMIGTTFYESCSFNISPWYQDVRDQSWPECASYYDFLNLPGHIQQECSEIHHITRYQSTADCYSHIIQHVREQKNIIKHHTMSRLINGAMVARIGKDLYFGTENNTENLHNQKILLDKQFPDTRNHLVNTGGHSDGTYCPVCPGLIISLRDVPTYAETFPGWEVVYLPGQSWDKVAGFLHLKEQNKGRWWIPGFEHDTDVVNVVEGWLDHWTGYVEETVFDVNMLIVDPKNVIVFNYNKQVFDALSRYGITPHVVPFRHRYFWDGGVHCITSDLHREGGMKDYFSQRG